MIHIGTSQKTGSVQAGLEAAAEAKKKLAADQSVSRVLAFCGGRHEPDGFLEGIRSELGDVLIYGGSAAGIITNESLGYTGYECGLLLFADNDIQVQVVTGNLEPDDFEAGREMGCRLDEIAEEGDTVLLFYDNVRSLPPPVLHLGSKLVDGLYEGLAGKKLHIIGGGLLGDFKLTPSFIFDGRKTIKHAAVALVLPGKVLRPHTTIMHGCTPVSSFLEITGIEGAVLYELDSRPAVEVICEKLDINRESLPELVQSLLVTIGKKYGDLFAPFDERMYVNRLLIDCNLEKGSVTLFEADYQLGAKVQIMSRDNQVMLESVRKGTAQLLDSVDAESLLFGLYINCAGRASAFSGAKVEEADVVIAQIGNRVPLLGLYSGVEIGPLLGRSRPLDWTGLLTVFTAG